MPGSEFGRFHVTTREDGQRGYLWGFNGKSGDLRLITTARAPDDLEQFERDAGTREPRAFREYHFSSSQDHKRLYVWGFNPGEGRLDLIATARAPVDLEQFARDAGTRDLEVYQEYHFASSQDGKRVYVWGFNPGEGRLDLIATTRGDEGRGLAQQKRLDDGDLAATLEARHTWVKEMALVASGVAARDDVRSLARSMANERPRGELQLQRIARDESGTTQGFDGETKEALEALRDARGLDADRVFLNRMIGHHHSTMELIRAAQPGIKREDLRKVVETRLSDLEHEVEEMHQVLNRL